MHYNGDRATIFIHRDFRDIAQSVSYADFYESTARSYRDRHIAVNEAVIMGFTHVHVPQLVDGRWLDAINPACQSFCDQAYVKCGLQHLDYSKIIIDRRHPEDEAELVRTWMDYNDRLPTVLVNTTAISNPVPKDAARIQSILGTRLCGKAYVVDLATIRAKRFTDLLGLCDRAKCLVTVDTATLHLAGAHTIPYVALLADKPTPWFGSYCRGNVIRKARYGDAVTDPDFVSKIVNSVQSTIT
jgi:hypothetical protein